MNLIVDIGNTRLKTALYDGDELQEARTFDHKEDWEVFLKTVSFDRFIYAQVGKDHWQVKEALLLSNAEGVMMHQSIEVPFRNAYSSKSTLGLDRIALVAGAHFLYPQKNVLIIDMGSCVTYDFIDSQGVYHGGAISPGLQMRLRALHNFTAALPLVNYREQIALIGDSTENSILAGVVHGLVGEIDYFIKSYSSKFQTVSTLMCGGDGKYFESKIKEPIFAVPNLVLQGLNRILKHNVSK